MTESIPTVKQRRRRYRDAIIEDILRIAREQMRKEGVAALSFNAIARRLGMRPPSLYNYFDSKNAIYDELFRRGFLEFGRRMEERPCQDAPLRENLQSVMKTYMRFAQENPDLYQLMFQRPVPDFAPSEASMAVSLSLLETARAQLAQMLQSEELSLTIPLEEACDLFIALQHGLTELHLANNPELPAGEGRFGKLIPLAVQMILNAWQKS
ncbi:MAG TPA: TetR/AcrR family transcriptional regulator [Caldilineaceae bacterium]|nr:TetR/AcrR family transcriptional regulator [Caldilineaceae bacterium]